MSTEFNNRRVNRDNHLDLSGIGHDFMDEMSREIEQAHKVAADIANRMVQQIIYDYTTNIPCGILTRAECQGHGIKHGIVSGFSAHVQWDINAVIEMCGDMLEDVNAHDAAAKVRGGILS